MKEHVCKECGALYEVITRDNLARSLDRTNGQHCTHPTLPPADENGFKLTYLLLQRPGRPNRSLMSVR